MNAAQQQLPMPTEFHAFTGESRAAREQEWQNRAVHLVMQAFPGTEIEQKQAA